uniref:tRNA (guanosine(18)-2'-O)-methyltransferase TARBP1 n=1 Tax=Sphaeramia orbicularis TaxID=375764 RepID=A0A673BRI5_9TELE
MNSVLINAVLSSSPDYELLFKTLSWPSESWPETERVEALTAFIQGLGSILSDSDTFTDAKRQRIIENVESVIWIQCLPFLCKISTEAADGSMRCRESTAAVCGLVSACVRLCDRSVPGKVALSVLPSIQMSEEELPGPGRLNVEVANELMAALLPSLSADEHLTHTILSRVLSCIRTLPNALVSKITVRLLLNLLNCCSDGRLSTILKLIMDDLSNWHYNSRTSVVTERSLLCLTTLSDHLMRPHSDPDPRVNIQFWRMVQDGLTHRDSVSRKRALYLLKRCVALSEEEGVDTFPSQQGKNTLFKWTSDRSKLLREFWEDYALVMETLEENQVHVVRPVLNRIDTLIQMTANDSQGHGLLHPSWLLCVYQRMFHSENKTLMREGVYHLLALQNHLLCTFNPQFIIGPFMDVLSETSLFQRSELSKPGVSNSFQFRACVLLQLIQQLGSKHWCAVPLLFVSQALSKLPPSPLLGINGLTALREVLRCTMITHQVLLRGAAQCFLLKSVLSLTDVSAVTLDDIFSFLMHFRADESLCRGTQLWNQLCVWLSDNEDMKNSHSILLCVDMEKIRAAGDIRSTLESLLSPLLDTLSRVSTNIYLPVRKSDKSLQLMLQLLQLGRISSSQPGGEDQVVAMASLATISNIQKEKQATTHSAHTQKKQGPRQPPSKNWLKFAHDNEYFTFFYSDTEEHGPALQDWGRIVAHYMRDQWTCLSVLIKAVGIPESVEISRASETLKAALSCGVEALALLPSDLVLPVFTFTERVLPQLVHEEEPLCVDAVTVSWVLVQGLSTNAHDFWPALKGFISMAFHYKLLELTETRAPMLTAITTQLMELSDSKSGVFSMLIHHCCQMWMPTGQGSRNQTGSIFSSVFSHIKILTEACVYGPVFRRDQRLIQDVQTYVEQLGEECAANIAVSSDNRDDQLPRTCVLSFLSRLDSSDLEHQRLMENLITDLLKKDNDISKSKVRYYSNSLQHRVKNRVWQTLLLLLPKLREEFISTLLSRVFEAGFCSNQASVKYLIEWMMILILSRNPQHIDSFWDCFSMDHEKTKTSVCTFLSVLVHFSVILPHIKDKVVQLRKALDIILQWCFNHNFSVRLYALLALKRVWSLAEVRMEAEEGADGLRGVYLNTVSSFRNANKNWLRIQEHFFFGAFHPIRDFSVETIFYTFPSLSELADDEWIPPWKFEKLASFSQSPTCPLRNPASDLSQLDPGDWIQQDKSTVEERWADVQKKITPWRLGIQDQEPELQLVPQQRAARVGKLQGALLVVASLIDKPTNLGGLCRTCEIFGASALVLDSLRHVSDKHFQSLSVSSELWLPLLEVKPVELIDFLQLKKSEGYCIVGVEQTANSQSLQEYHFPEKTLLLLGNEREGIPANLLQMLDVCVEIPQQGVIRSLNVHVSAALLIWEYTRQHLTSSLSEVNSKLK